MSTITKIFIIGVSLFFFGCVPKEIPAPVVTDNVTEKVQEWENDQKNYWITLYFTRMSHDPNVRLRYPPEHLYNLCKCIIDIMSIDYDYQTFIRDFNKQPINPQNAQIVYDVSMKCSMEEIQLMKIKQQSQDPNPKDAI